MLTFIIPADEAALAPCWLKFGAKVKGPTSDAGRLLLRLAARLENTTGER